MSIKKPHTKTRSSSNAAKVTVKKASGTSRKVSEKTAKKISSAKTEKKTGLRVKAAVPRAKATVMEKTAPVSPAKTAGKGIKAAKKTEIKTPLKSTRTTKTKLSKPEKTVKTEFAEPTPGIKKLTKKSEVKKSVKSEISTGKPQKPSLKIASAKKTTRKGPLKKSPAKITQKKAITSVITKKPSARKVSKVVAGKTEGKTSKNIKAPAKPVSAAIKEKKSATKKSGATVAPQKIATPAITKKPSARKVSKVVAGKTEGKTSKNIKAPAKPVSTAIKEKKSTGRTVKNSLQKKSAISSTLPQIKETVKKKTVSTPKRKTEAPLPASHKTARKKLTSSLTAPGLLRAISEKTTAAHIPSPHAEKKAAQLKVFLPGEELLPEEPQRAPFPTLPEEYGENELLLMEVDPSIVFVSWEIKPDDISLHTGQLTLRVYDVTSINFDDSPAHRFFDIPLRSRVGSKFFDIKMPGKEVIMEVGLLQQPGKFKAIKRSNKVTMPALQIFDELGTAGSLSDAEKLIGY